MKNVFDVFDLTSGISCVVTAGSQCWPNCVATAAAHNERGLILAQIIPANGQWVSLIIIVIYWQLLNSQ